MIQWFKILEDTYESHREGGTKNMNIVRIQYKGKISIFIPNPNYLHNERYKLDIK